MSWGRMRPTGSCPRPKPVPPPPPTPTPTPVVVIDGDDDDGGGDDSEVFIIKDAAEIARTAAACNSKKGNSSGSNVINLDDDDEDEEEEEEEEEEGGRGDRAGPSTVGAGSPAATTPPGHAIPRNRYGLDYVSDSEQSDLSEGSDSDSDSDSESDGSSDCEILPSRKLWEKAASRRTVPHEPPQRKDGRASTSASSAESSTHNDERDAENFSASEGPLDDNIYEYFRYAFNPSEPSRTSGAMYGAGPSSVPNVQECPMDDVPNRTKTEDRNPTCSLNPDTAGNDEATHSCKDPVPEKAPEKSHPPPADETLNPEGYTGYSFVSKNRVFPACSADWKDSSRLFVSTPERMDEKIPECSLPLKDLVDDSEQLAVVRDGPDFQDGLIGAREKHKESDEYKRAQEEEWASRQRQLAIQAEEAQEAKRLRKRKKAEALRLLDVEKRQKQRIEEVRETQRKSEEDTQLKEQCRGAVRLELENVERTCRDVSSILRALGIPVEGGEVKAAFKRAALKFHPDRVSRKDIYEQVKAEETFKFISRFKEKLKL
uniref:Uncharacterized protein n=1 Tax=Avena sativa TaxID=4498 RepID=A0ACD5WAF5_AVESA